MIPATVWVLLSLFFEIMNEPSCAGIFLSLIPGIGKILAIYLIPGIGKILFVRLRF